LIRAKRKISGDSLIAISCCGSPANHSSDLRPATRNFLCDDLEESSDGVYRSATMTTRGKQRSSSFGAPFGIAIMLWVVLRADHDNTTLGAVARSEAPLEHLSPRR
jgi:hypothetical protein